MGIVNMKTLYGRVPIHFAERGRQMTEGHLLQKKHRLRTHVLQWEEPIVGLQYF